MWNIENDRFEKFTINNDSDLFKCRSRFTIIAAYFTSGKLDAVCRFALSFFDSQIFAFMIWRLLWEKLKLNKFRKLNETPFSTRLLVRHRRNGFNDLSDFDSSRQFAITSHPVVKQIFMKLAEKIQRFEAKIMKLLKLKLKIEISSLNCIFAQFEH